MITRKVATTALRSKDFQQARTTISSGSFVFLFVSHHHIHMVDFVFLHSRFLHFFCNVFFSTLYCHCMQEEFDRIYPFGTQIFAKPMRWVAQLISRDISTRHSWVVRFLRIDVVTFPFIHVCLDIVCLWWIRDVTRKDEVSMHATCSEVWVAMPLWWRLSGHLQHTSKFWDVEPMSFL